MDALARIDGLLEQAGTRRLDGDECRTLVELLGQVPGRARALVDALGRQRDAAAVDALLMLPTGTGGVIEAVFAALRSGVARARVDGGAGPRMLAIEFRESRSRRFPAVLARAQQAFADELERLAVADEPCYRVALFEGGPPSLARRVRARAIDLEALHRELLRLRGVRVWLNGWRLDDASPLRPPARVHLLRAWLDWAQSRSGA